MAVTALAEERYQTDASPIAICSSLAPRKRPSYSSRVPIACRSSLLKKCGSFSGDIKIFRCSPSQTDTDVVPHFGAPMMKKLGFRKVILRNPPGGGGHSGACSTVDTLYVDVRYTPILGG